MAILEAGLPNATGMLNDVTAGQGFSINGVFSENWWAQKVDTWSVGLTNGWASIRFSLSNSNAIYGSSVTVQPPALQLIPQIRY